MPVGFANRDKIYEGKDKDIRSAGQSVAQAEEIKPAGDIVREMVSSYVEACNKLQETIVLDG